MPKRVNRTAQTPRVPYLPRPSRYCACVNVSYQTPDWRDYDRRLTLLAKLKHGKSSGSGMYLPTMTRDMDFDFKEKGDAEAFAESVRNMRGTMKGIKRIKLFKSE